MLNMEIDIWDHNLAAFFGSFTSEGTLTNQLGLKVTSTDLDFLNYTTECARHVFGGLAATRRNPTREHKYIEDGYHKYYSKEVAKFLVSNYGVKPGRKVLSNQGLPEFIMDSVRNNKNVEKTKLWLKRYIQMRFSGDAHVQVGLKNIITRRIVLTRNIALQNLDEKLLNDIASKYSKKKIVRNYPPDLLEVLKSKGKEMLNFPQEFFDIQCALQKLFYIISTMNFYGIRSIYYDNKIQKLLVTGIYRLVIARKREVIKFANSIGFAPFDLKNRQKLINLTSSYKG